ncbi:hypothetical protein CK203_095607 [Vitis vinifera]|uniref:Uncharacterized protein n=1 Tax=Vitis vinifera TaxID=29760 RepID=A0A438FHG5_VITVI|nr:hypothetical protein CK203_095607 [Vitis vinifera]
MSAHLPSLQLVTNCQTRRREGEGTRDGPGCMGGVEASGRPFSPNYSLVIPGPEKRGHLVDWVEKASFACLSKLFEIDAKERHYKTLLTARNLMAVVRESQEYVVNILPRKCQRRGASEPCSSFYLKRIRTRRGAEPLKYSLAAVARLANLAEEAASINHPDSPNPDVDAAEAVCATPMEEAGAESQSQPSDDPDRLALVLVKGPPSKRPRSGAI